MTSSQMETDLPLSPPVDPPTETEIAAEEPANGFPDDVKEIWVYKRHIQTTTKHGGHDSCFTVKRNTVDHKMYLSGPPSYKKVPVYNSLVCRDDNDCILLVCGGKHKTIMMFKGCLVGSRADQYVFEGILSFFNSKSEMVMYVAGCEVKGEFFKWKVTPEPKVLKDSDDPDAKVCQQVVGSFRRKFALDLKRDTDLKQGSMKEVMDVGLHAIEQLILYFGKELFEWLKEKSKKNPKLQTLLQENVLKAGNDVSLDQIIAAGGCKNVSELLAVQEGKPVPVSPETPPEKKNRKRHMHDDECLALRVFIERDKCNCSIQDKSDDVPQKDVPQKSDDVPQKSDDVPKITMSQLFGSRGFKVRREDKIDGHHVTWHGSYTM